MFKIAKQLQENFLRCILDSFQEFALKKNFVIRRKASMNFLERCCTHDYIQILHLRKRLKQAKIFKEFFKNAFKIIIQKICTQEKFRTNLKEKFQFLSINES